MTIKVEGRKSKDKRLLVKSKDKRQLAKRVINYNI